MVNARSYWRSVKNLCPGWQGESRSGWEKGERSRPKKLWLGIRQHPLVVVGAFVREKITSEDA